MIAVYLFDFGTKYFFVTPSIDRVNNFNASIFVCRKLTRHVHFFVIYNYADFAGVFGAIGKFRKPLRRGSGMDVTDGPSPQPQLPT